MKNLYTWKQKSGHMEKTKTSNMETEKKTTCFEIKQKETKYLEIENRKLITWKQTKSNQMEIETKAKQMEIEDKNLQV